MNKFFFTGLILVALAIAGYFFAPLGMPAVVAALFFVPGAVIASALGGRRLSLLEVLCLSIVISILVSTHLAYWLASLFGYSRLVVTAAVAILCASALFYAPQKRELGVDRKKTHALLALGIALAFFAVLLAMYHTNFWSERGGSIVVGGWNWSDLFVHLPVALTINSGNFPPQNPFFAGEPLVYHYFMDLHSAIAAKYFDGGLNAVIEVMRLENSLLPPLFFLLCFLLARRVTGKDSTALIAALLIVFGAGFAYVKIAPDLASGKDFLQIIKDTPYDNDWQFFQIQSLLGGYLLVQRAQMIGLPALAAVLMLLVVGREGKDWKAWLLAGLVAGLLAPFQYFAFITAYAAIAIFLLSKFHSERKIDFASAGGAVVPVVFSLPFALQAVFATSRAGHVNLSLGWLAPKDPVGFAFFYLANLGIPFMLAIAAIFFAKTKWKRELLALAAFCFILPNVLSLSGTVWDMGKFFTYLWVVVGVLAAVLLKDRSRAVVAAAIILSAITPLQMLYWTASSNWQALDAQEMGAGKWIAANTPQGSVFVTGESHSSPVDAVGGRLRVVGYAGWMNNFGFPYQSREALLPKAYCGQGLEKTDAIRQLGASYLYSGPDERRTYACNHGAGLQLLFSNNETAVYQLK